MKFDTAPLSREFARIAEGARNQAIPRAFNRAATSARAVMARAIAKDMGLKQAAIKEAIKIVEATPEKHEARLEASGKRIPLIDFGAKGPEPSRGRGKGVRARTPQSRTYPRAFIATMRSGHRGVFQRKGKTRLPIVELHGPSLPFVFDKYRNEGIAKFEESVMKNLQSEFRFLLRQATA